MEALQNGQAPVEGSIEGQSAGAASHAMIEKILSEEPRWQGNGHRRQAPHQPVRTLLLPEGPAHHHPRRGASPLTPLPPANSPRGTSGSFPRHALVCSHHPRCTPHFSGLSHMRTCACI